MSHRLGGVLTWELCSNFFATCIAHHRHVYILLYLRGGGEGVFLLYSAADNIV